MTPAPYSFRRKGRSWGTLMALLGLWTLCLVGWRIFDIAPLLLALLLLLSLPALWDFYAARDAGTDLTDQSLSWFSGARTASVDLAEIEHVRLVTQLDLSVRAAVVLTSGRKLRLPAEATPPRDAFETALTEHNIRSQRHHFTFI